MIKARELKLYVENMEGFRKKLKGELRQIDRGKAKTLGEDSISFHSLDQLRKYLTPKRLELLRMMKVIFVVRFVMEISHYRIILLLFAVYFS